MRRALAFFVAGAHAHSIEASSRFEHDGGGGAPPSGLSLHGMPEHAPGASGAKFLRAVYSDHITSLLRL